MASVQQCEQALRRLADRLSAVDAEQRARYVVERTITCAVPDLGVVFGGTLNEDGLHDVRLIEEPAAQVRLAAESDDLIALTEGRLSAPAAWASGRLKIEASLLDLLKLRSLL